MRMGALPFFDAGRLQLDRLAMPGLLCAFDFDGTLAPIVRQPEKAVVPPAVLRRLQRLAACTPVAIITGRSVSDLRSRLPFEPHFVIGNHGLEGLPGLDAQAVHWRAQCAAWEASLSAALARERRASIGIVVENKGYSLALHYRLAPDRDAACGILLDLCRVLAPEAHLVGGKCVINLLPASGVGKGYALERLIEASGAHGALYAGDDLNDEDVFRLRRPDVLGVRIERDASSAAEFFLPHRLDLVHLLDELLRRVS
jgi:trehalose 6-phosphate phosphatase